MVVQDDAREHELCNLFNLEWDPAHARSGTDARYIGRINGKEVDIPFEVKSSTTTSVSTSRDVGMKHIQKWRGKHWVFGFYEASATVRPVLRWCLYLSPRQMAPWIDELEAYLSPDHKLTERAPNHLTYADLHNICGEKDIYTLEDARALHKKQLSAEEYKAQFDVPSDSPTGYSPQKMLEILRLRARYLMERGSTLNNPHIPKSFFDKFSDEERVVRNHAERLKRRLEEELGL